MTRALADYPVADERLINPRLSEQMGVVRRLVELGRAAQADSGVKTRQPLSRALASAPGFADLFPDLLAEIARADARQVPHDDSESATCSRVAPGCPAGRPGPRPDLPRNDLGTGLTNPSAEGGRDEFFDDCFS